MHTARGLFGGCVRSILKPSYRFMWFMVTIALAAWNDYNMCIALALTQTLSLARSFMIHRKWQNKCPLSCIERSDRNGIITKIPNTMFVSHLPTKWCVHINFAPPILSLCIRILLIANCDIWKQSEKKKGSAQPSQANREQNEYGIESWTKQTFWHTHTLWNFGKKWLFCKIKLLSWTESTKHQTMKEQTNKRTNEYV